MKGILRKNIDYVGGVGQGLIIQGSPNVFINGEPVVRIGDAVADYGTHSNVHMMTGSSNIFVNGIGVCREGDLATDLDVAVGGNTFNVFTS